MRPEISQLLESARALQLKPTGETGPRCVKFGIDASLVPERLLVLHHAIEAVDKAGSSSVDAGAPDPAHDPEKLRAAIDGLFNWMKLQGLNTGEAADIVAAAITGKQKAQKRYVTLPRFAPQAVRRKKKWKPKTHLGAKFDGDGAPSTMNEHRGLGREMDEVVMRLGHAAPR